MRDGKEVTIDRYAVPQMHEQHVSEVQPGTFPCVFCLDLVAYILNNIGKVLYK